VGAEQQQGTWYQPSLLAEGLDDVRHDASGEGGTKATVHEEQQTPTASQRERALTSDLMAQVCKRDNLNRAYKRVKANHGAPGVDGMTVSDLYAWLG
jgi:RNA-directed DNA polymerase